MASKTPSKTKKKNINSKLSVYMLIIKPLYFEVHIETTLKQDISFFILHHLGFSTTYQKSFHYIRKNNSMLTVTLSDINRIDVSYDYTKRPRPVYMYCYRSNGIWLPFVMDLATILFCFQEPSHLLLINTRYKTQNKMSCQLQSCRKDSCKTCFCIKSFTPEFIEWAHPSFSLDIPIGIYTVLVKDQKERAVSSGSTLFAKEILIFIIVQMYVSKGYHNRLYLKAWRSILIRIEAPPSL